MNIQIGTTSLMKKIFFMLIIVFMLSVIVGCSSPENDNTLMGSWMFADNPAWQYEFYSDGTGHRGIGSDLQHFNWSTLGDNRLILRWGGRYRDDNWDYLITGNRLELNRIDGGRESFSYLRVEHNASIVGAWDWDLDSEYRYIFYADGTGSRGFHTVVETFEWFTADNLLIFYEDGTLYEHWGYVIVDNIITMSNVIATDMNYSYVKSEG
jgi:hypothetical protein